MIKIFKDDLLEIKEILLSDEFSVFQNIFNQDKLGFKLKYIPEYSFNACNENNLINNMSDMGACNFSKYLYDATDFRCYGIKISDPENKILGAFHFRGSSIIYSPIVPRVFEEYDYGKFGITTYFTTSTMAELVGNQIKYSYSFFVHIDENYNASSKIIANKGNAHILKEVSAKEILEYAVNPDLGSYYYDSFINKRIKS